MTLSKNQVLMDLRLLRALLEREGAWTQKANARDKNGLRVSYPPDNTACSWDLIGGIECVVMRDYPNQPLSYRDPVEWDQAQQRRGTMRKLLEHAVFWPAPYVSSDYTLRDYNDHPKRTKAEVLMLIDQAIKTVDETWREPKG